MVLEKTSVSKEASGMNGLIKEFRRYFSSFPSGYWIWDAFECLLNKYWNENLITIHQELIWIYLFSSSQSLVCYLLLYSEN